MVTHPFLDHPGPLPFAHRGGASDAPENTMAAFEHAVNLGYQYLETDVHVTADAVAVAFHDDDLTRTCGRPGRISELTWAEVASARVSGSEPIPRLDELIATWPQARWNLDCKSDAAIDALVQVLQRLDVVQRVCVGAFSDRRLATLRGRLGPSLCTSLGPVATARLVAASRTHHAIARPRGLAAQVPLRQGRVPVVTAAFVRTAHRLGLQVHVWTVDDPGEMHRLLDLGVDGIMTDRPAVLREVLEQRGQWVDPG
jgi:glycerophosphoryl diester phosphodiesterase